MEKYSKYRVLSTAPKLRISTIWLTAKYLCLITKPNLPVPDQGTFDYGLARGEVGLAATVQQETDEVGGGVQRVAAHQIEAQRHGFFYGRVGPLEVYALILREKA